MRKVFFESLPAYQFHTFQKFSDQLGHAVFSRDGGVSKKPYDSLNVRFGVGDNEKNVKKNREKICDSLGIEKNNLISANQTHSKNIKVVDELFLKNYAGQEIDKIDGFVTALPDIALMIQVADCQAILFYDQTKKVVAAIHAGWRGLAMDISGAAIRMMRKEFGVDSANILVGIAPSLGPCCSFFSNPESELPCKFEKFIDKQKRVDLWSFSLAQLQNHGIPKRNIELARVCTQCGNGQKKDGSASFFSFRGNMGITGRFGVTICIKSK